jgi:hypothetical protein
MQPFSSSGTNVLCCQRFGLKKEKTTDKKRMEFFCKQILPLIFFLVLLSTESRCDLTADSEFSVSIDNDAPISDFVAPRRVYGFYELAPTSNSEMVWQSPERAGFGPSVAVLFMAHGCSHAATDFFDKSKDCVDCIGLPVERRLVLAALKKGFFVVAVSSNDRVGSRLDFRFQVVRKIAATHRARSLCFWRFDFVPRCWRYLIDQPRVKVNHTPFAFNSHDIH